MSNYLPKQNKMSMPTQFTTRITMSSTTTTHIPTITVPTVSLIPV